MGPDIHPYLRELYNEVLSKYDVFLQYPKGVGTTFQDAHDLVDADRNELQMAYHFDYVSMSGTTDGYKLAEFKTIFSRWDSAFADKRLACSLFVES